MENRPVNVEDGRTQMSMEHFRKWLLAFDDENNGKISLKELTEAFRMTEVWFSWWKARRAMKFADSDGNSFIDEPEIEKLVEFVQENLGVTKLLNPSIGLSLSGSSNQTPVS